MAASLDNAEIEPAESPWAWYHWTAKGMLPEDALISRATDALGRTQPIDGLAVEPAGYEWNGVDHVELTVLG